MKGFKKCGILSLALLMLLLASCGAAKGDDAGKTGPQGTPAELIDQLYAQHDPGLSLETREVDLTDSLAVQSYLGLSDGSQLQEAAVSEPMMSSQAYSLVVARVPEGTSADSVAQEMKSGINPRKWICVEADDLQVAVCGDVILLVMMDSALSDSVTSTQIVDAFRTVCGGTISTI